MNKMQYKYNNLPIIGINNNSFFSLDESKEESKIKNLINKYIIFELWDKENHGIQVLPGKLLKYDNDCLLIRQYDDGTEETRKEWTDSQGNDLFKDFEERINIKNIRGIEEYKKVNPSLEFKEEFQNQICEITNKNNEKITVLIKSFDGYAIWFDYKYSDNGIYIGESCYPLYLIKNIEIQQYM